MGLIKELLKNRVLYLLALPEIVLIFLFGYLPIIGLIVVFKNFHYDLGIFRSPWEYPIYNNFLFFFTSGYALRVTLNTLFLNALFIFLGTVFAIGLALVLNEIQARIFKKVVQSFTFLPYFISWIVVSVFAYNIFSYEHGTLNSLIHLFGLEKVNWYTEPGYWPVILLFVYIWKQAGYSCIVYLAAIAGIDPSYYDSAMIDGATRLQQIKHITLPLLMPTATILVLLAIGRIMNSDFGMFYALIGDATQLYSTVDVIDTFVYRSLRNIGDVGMASAAGFYQSFVSFILVLVSNKIAKKYQQESSLF